eukprot:jgi/Tetstr1/426002/TSEL_016350.t1
MPRPARVAAARRDACLRSGGRLRTQPARHRAAASPIPRHAGHDTPEGVPQGLAATVRKTPCASSLVAGRALGEAETLRGVIARGVISARRVREARGMGQKGLSRIARALAACGGGSQAETAKKSLEVPGKDPCDKRLSRFNSLYDDGAACAVGDSLTLVGLTLDEQKALEQQSYALETSKLDHPEGLTQHGGAHNASGEGRAEGTPAPREVAVRCFLGDTRESAQDKPSLLATGIKHDPELMDDSLGDRDEYDNGTLLQLGSEGEEGMWEPFTQVIDCVRDWQHQVREMKARTMEIEASCMREATQDPSPAMLRLSALEARCRHAEDENLQLRVQVNEYEKQCSALLHRNSRYAALKKNMSANMEEQVTRNAALQQTVRQWRIRAEEAEARVSQLWRMIVELESSVSKGMELQSVQRQLLDAKRQVASLEADFKQSQGSLVQMQQPGQKHGMGLSPSHETFSELSSKSPGQGLRPSAKEGGKTGQALRTEGRGVASTPLSCYTDCESQPKEAVPSLEEMASPLICDSNGVHISDSRRQEVPSFDLNSQGPPPPAFGLQHPQQSPPPQYGFHQTRSGAAWSSPDMLALRGAAPAPSYVPIQWSPNLEPSKAISVKSREAAAEAWTRDSQERKWASICG